MLSKNKIKFIQSLNRKKIRDNEQLFLVEGNKMVLEAIHSALIVDSIYATKNFINGQLPANTGQTEVVECIQDELEKASLLKNPQQALAVVQIPRWQFKIEEIKNELSLALDFIQDPGNLGTIIRIADWFGIKQILCSENTVDCFNPKVVQASMGAVFRIQVHYLNLEETLVAAKSNGISVYGTFLEGKNIYQSQLESKGILVMGNEGNGISPPVEKAIQYKIHIPSFVENGSGSESLNVATATAICCSEFKRRTILQ